jgi:hypothetical protein
MSDKLIEPIVTPLEQMRSEEDEAIAALTPAERIRKSRRIDDRWKNIVITSLLVLCFVSNIISGFALGTAQKAERNSHRTLLELADAKASRTENKCVRQIRSEWERQLVDLLVIPITDRNAAAVKLNEINERYKNADDICTQDPTEQTKEK